MLAWPEFKPIQGHLLTLQQILSTLLGTGWSQEMDLLVITFVPFKLKLMTVQRIGTSVVCGFCDSRMLQNVGKREILVNLILKMLTKCQQFDMNRNKNGRICTCTPIKDAHTKRQQRQQKQSKKSTRNNNNTTLKNITERC